MPTNSNIESLKSRGDTMHADAAAKTTEPTAAQEQALRLHELVAAMTETTLRAGQPTYEREYQLLHARMVTFAKSEGRPLQRRIRDVFQKAGGLLAREQARKGGL